MTLVAAVVAYLIGSVPTAAALARLAGIDLRSSGSGNPGANNALRLGGKRLAAAVLAVEIAKGYLAVFVGAGLGGDAAAALAGVSAAAGNVYNIWYRGQGGKGLAISGGVLAAASPVLAAIGVVTIAVVVALTRSSGTAALSALVTMSTVGIVAWQSDWQWPGLSAGAAAAMAVGLAAVLWQKHWRDHRTRRSSRPATPQ